MRSSGGAEESCKEELAIWKTEDEENSGNDKTWRRGRKEGRGGQNDQKGLV